MSDGQLSDAEMSSIADSSDFEMGDSDIESDADADFLDGTIDDKRQRKGYEVEAKAITSREIRRLQEEQAEQVSNLLAQSRDTSLILLRHYKWNKERLINHLLENADTIMEQAGVFPSAVQPEIEVVQNFECPICCDDGDLETIAMQCGHRYCKGCYSRSLYEKIVEDGEVRGLACPTHKCNAALSETIVQLLVEPEVYDRYIRLLDKIYVDDHDKIKWCPFPGCDSAVECASTQAELDHLIPSVVCSENHPFCFGCSLAEHQPCMCSLVKIWQKKCEDDSETSNWISAHTKECPKCSSTIEKNGGCNHMTCRKCRYEFCWVCMGDWKEHGQSWYNCNRYEEKASAGARDNQAKSRASLERYLHYYNRFANHEQSSKLSHDLYLRSELKMNQIQLASKMSWIEVQFLRTAVDELTACRRTLKWTYALAFYLKRTNATELFEDNQKDLEMAVEQLSGLCEQPIIEDQIDKMRAQVLDKTKYVAQRREMFLTDTALGLAEGRWEFTVDTTSLTVKRSDGKS